MYWTVPWPITYASEDTVYYSHSSELIIIHLGKYIYYADPESLVADTWQPSEGKRDYRECVYMFRVAVFRLKFGSSQISVNTAALKLYLSPCIVSL